MDSSEQHAHIINNFENIYYGAPKRGRRSTRWSYVLRGPYRMAARDMEEALRPVQDDRDVHSYLALGLLRGIRSDRGPDGLVRRVCRHVGIAVPLRRAPVPQAMTQDGSALSPHRYPHIPSSRVALVTSPHVESARTRRARSLPREAVVVAPRAEGGEFGMTRTEPERCAGERKKKLEKYFAAPPDPRELITARCMMGVGGAGVVVAAVLFAITTPLFGGAVLWCATAVALMGCTTRARYARERDAAEPRPSDAEMDHVFASDLVDITATALKRLGLGLDDLALTGGSWDPIAQLERGDPVLTSADRPLLVFGPHHPAKMAMGRDGVWRFSAYSVMVICPTYHNLGLYTCVLDLLTGATSREETHEYHYDDVVAVSTVTTADDEPAHPVDLHFEREFPSLLQELSIVISSGDRPSITVGVAGRGGTGRALVQSSGIDEVIADVRRILRDKKGTRELHLP
jgi:hypothetical protein